MRIATGEQGRRGRVGHGGWNGSARSEKPARLRIGYQAIPNAELVAKQLKWHEQALGIPIEWRQFESGRDVNTAIVAGSIDLGLSGSGGAATALAQGMTLSVIAIHDVIGRSEALAVRGPIRDVAGASRQAPRRAVCVDDALFAVEAAGDERHRRARGDAARPESVRHDRRLDSR